MSALPPILFLIGFVMYAVQTVRGKVTPHLGSWVVWGCISISNAVTCLWVMDDLAACAIPVLDAFCVSAFVLTLWRKTSSDVSLSNYDKGLMGMAIAGASVAFYDPALSTLLVQIPLVLAVWPTILGAVAGDEEPAVWSMWTVALLVNLGATSGDFSQWVYPTIMFALHGVVLAAIGGAYVRELGRRSVVATPIRARNG